MQNFEELVPRVRREAGPIYIIKEEEEEEFVPRVSREAGPIMRFPPIVQPVYICVRVRVCVCVKICVLCEPVSVCACVRAWEGA